MNSCRGISKFWFLAVLLVTFVAGCGGSSSTAPSSSKAITAYSLTGTAGTITESAKTIAVSMPYGTILTALPATFTTTGASVKVGAVVQTSGTTANNFNGTVEYIVTAADSTTATYSVAVSVAQQTTKAITAYSFGGATGAIDEAAKTIAVTVPDGTNLATLKATFATTGASVRVGAVAQVSGTTANDFSSPSHSVEYVVTAVDGTTATYTVTVALANSTDKAIITYSLDGAVGVIDEDLKTIAVSVPNGTDVTTLVAIFRTTGVSVKVGADVQASDTTPNDFTNPVLYTVAAGDTSTAVYTVTVTESLAKGPAPVNLGTAGNFVILAKSAVSTTGTTAVVGDIGVSPSAATYITGFSLIADATNTFSRSSLVTGKIYAANYADSTPAYMTTAIGDMEIAFADAAGRTSPGFTELGAGDVSGMTLVPGLYKWGTGVLITSAGVTLEGGADDVWIFQIAQNLTVNNSAIITLSGGAQAKNIFWQVAGQATLGTAADFKGIILSKTLISLNTGTIMNGRALAQTAVTLNATAITAPVQ